VNDTETTAMYYSHSAGTERLLGLCPMNGCLTPHELLVYLKAVLDSCGLILVPEAYWPDKRQK